MPIYVYETVAESPDATVERFEVKQGFDDAPLLAHPATGQPVRRVISGGLGLVGSNQGHSLPDNGPGCGPENCQCGRFN